MSLGIRADPVFSLRIVELPMPTGSKDTGVLLDWLLDSMGLVRRSGGDESGALHRIMREAFLTEPLRGWDSKELGDQTGLSNTGIHHQMVKLRECGLVAAQVDGKWHRYVLRGGSMASAVTLVESQALTILGIRLSELDKMVLPSETRMSVEAEEEETIFSIRIREPGPTDDDDQLSTLTRDMGFSGENKASGDGLARDILSELCSNHHPITLMALSERLSHSRGRVSTVIDRMRSSGFVERVPMLERINSDVFAGLERQFDARGEEWLMSRGGLGRLEESVSSALMSGVRNGELSMEKIQFILQQVPIKDMRILLNTLGGRMPFGFRLTGSDGKAISTRVMRKAQSQLRRLRTVAERLEEALSATHS